MHKFTKGAIYRIFTVARPEGFIFQVLGEPGAKGMTGYMDESASWPRSVQFNEITRVEENPTKPVFLT